MTLACVVRNIAGYSILSSSVEQGIDLKIFPLGYILLCASCRAWRQQSVLRRASTVHACHARGIAEATFLKMPWAKIENIAPRNTSSVTDQTVRFKSHWYSLVDFFVDECALNTDNCDAQADCTDTRFSFECACQTGYEGSGVQDDCKGK